jgi:hypothetical protein
VYLVGLTWVPAVSQHHRGMGWETLCRQILLSTALAPIGRPNAAMGRVFRTKLWVQPVHRDLDGDIPVVMVATRVAAPAATQPPTHITGSLEEEEGLGVRAVG